MTIAIVCFVLLEIIIRTTAPLVSGNVKQISEIQDVAADMSEKQSAVLFLGNSLMGNALDINEFDRQSDLNIPTYKVVPDSTSLWDWSCIIKNTFIDHGRRPKVVVIGYAWGQVGPVPSRLGGFFCTIKDLPVLISLGMSNSSDILEFLVSKISTLYAMHETIGKRILDIIIPNYRIYTQAINAEKNKNKPVFNATNKSEDYRLLKAYIEMLVNNDIKPVVVVMPVQQHYELDDEFFNTIRQNGGLTLDYRELENLDKSMFRDAIHLNEQGNKVFTYQLAVDLKNI